MIILLIAALTLAHLFTPFWWWIIPLPFAYGFLQSTGGFKAFVAGGSGSGIVWLAAAFYYARDAAVLMPKIDTLIEAQAGGLQFIAIGLIALLCGGSACACGFFLRDVLHSKAGAVSSDATD